MKIVKLLLLSILISSATFADNIVKDAQTMSIRDFDRKWSSPVNLPEYERQMKALMKAGYHEYLNPIHLAYSINVKDKEDQIKEMEADYKKNPSDALKKDIEYEKKRLGWIKENLIELNLYDALVHGKGLGGKADSGDACTMLFCLIAGTTQKECVDAYYNAVKKLWTDGELPSCKDPKTHKNLSKGVGIRKYNIDVKDSNYCPDGKTESYYARSGRSDTQKCHVMEIDIPSSLTGGTPITRKEYISDANDKQEEE